MYTQLARNVHVGTAEQFSQAVSMEGANAIAFNATVMAFSGGTLTIQLQVSNDLENWFDVTSGTQTYTGVGYKRKRLTDIAEAYARLSYSLDDDYAVISVGINTADL